MRAKSYAVVLIVAGLLCCGLVLAANLLIDPQQVFGTGLFRQHSNPNFRFLRYIAYKQSARNVDALFFASSRGGGIPVMELAARTGLTYADFSVPLGTIGDHLPVLEHATRSVARQGKPVRHVFLLLDVDFLGRRPITNASIQTYLHPDVTGELFARFWFRYLMAIELRNWTNDLRRLWQHNDEIALAPMPQGGAGAVNRSDKSDDPPTVRDRVATSPNFNENLAKLRQFVDLCRRNEIALTVATSPLHRDTVQDYDSRDLAKAVDEVSAITGIWDFGSPQWLSERPDLWADQSHFTMEVGRMMLRRIFDGKPQLPMPPFGEYRAHASMSEMGARLNQ